MPARQGIPLLRPEFAPSLPNAPVIPENQHSSQSSDSMKRSAPDDGDEDDVERSHKKVAFDNGGRNAFAEAGIPLERPALSGLNPRNGGMKRGPVAQMGVPTHSAAASKPVGPATPTTTAPTSVPSFTPPSPLPQHGQAMGSFPIPPASVTPTATRQRPAPQAVANSVPLSRKRSSDNLLAAETETPQKRLRLSKDQDDQQQATQRFDSGSVRSARARTGNLFAAHKELEAQKLEAEKLEAEKLEAREAEAEKMDAEKLEAEKTEAEKLEAQKLKAQVNEARKLAPLELTAKGQGILNFGEPTLPVANSRLSEPRATSLGSKTTPAPLSHAKTSLKRAAEDPVLSRKRSRVQEPSDAEAESWMEKVPLPLTRRNLNAAFKKTSGLNARFTPSLRSSLLTGHPKTKPSTSSPDALIRPMLTYRKVEPKIANVAVQRAPAVSNSFKHGDVEPTPPTEVQPSAPVTSYFGSSIVGAFSPIYRILRTTSW